MYTDWSAPLRRARLSWSRITETERFGGYMSDVEEKTAESRFVPDFGPLSGVRIVYSGMALAGPWACTVLAEVGADVVWVENATPPEFARALRPLLIEQERRNQRNMALNIPTPAGREILLKLLA